MNTPAISVIIAMYNAEKYIAECLDSLLNQTFQDFEIILVDDCSTDFSRAVVYSFFPKFHDRLKLMKFKENSGLPGIPRNYALDMAKGKYVYFLDADDFLSPTALEELYNVAEEFNAEVVHVEKFASFPEEGSKEEATIGSIQQENFVTEPTLETLDLGKRVDDFTKRQYLWWACNKLFLKKFLDDNNIKFTPIKVWEDMIFAFKCVAISKVYVRVPFVSYYYRIRKDSLSHGAREIFSIFKTAFDVFNTLDSFMDTQEFFRENHEYKYKMLDFFMQDRLDGISENLFVTNDHEPAKLFKFLKEKSFTTKLEEYAAVMAYLFVNGNIFKVYTKQQAEEIAALKLQVNELKKIILEVVN